MCSSVGALCCGGWLVGELGTSTDGGNEQQHGHPVGLSLTTSKRSCWTVWRLICRPTGKQTDPPGARPPPTTTRRQRQVGGLRCHDVPVPSPLRSTVDGRPLSVNVSAVVSDAESGSIMRRRRDTDQFSGFATRPTQTTTTTTEAAVKSGKRRIIEQQSARGWPVCLCQARLSDIFSRSFSHQLFHHAATEANHMHRCIGFDATSLSH